MLGKLLKHEWKSTCKIMTVINLTVLLLTIAGFCILNMNIFGNRESTLLAVFLIIFYALSLAAFGIITEIYLYTRFYRNLFTSEGYLMHTLPVTPLQLFHAKLIVGYFWYVINSLLVIGGVLLFSFVAAWQFMDSQEAESTHRMLSDLNSVIFGGNNDVISAFRNTFGCTPLQAAGMTVLFQLSGSLAALLMGYVSILLGQLMEKYRLAGFCHRLLHCSLYHKSDYQLFPVSPPRFANVCCRYGTYHERLFQRLFLNRCSEPDHSVSCALYGFCSAYEAKIKSGIIIITTAWVLFYHMNAISPIRKTAKINLQISIWGFFGFSAILQPEGNVSGGGSQISILHHNSRQKPGRSADGHIPSLLQRVPAD